MPIEGKLLKSDVPLSFWGGVDPESGHVIDQHHPLAGHNLAGCVLALPSSRGSCSGSGVLLELIHNGRAPKALLFCETEEVLLTGALVAKLVFDHHLPVAKIDRKVFDALNVGDRIRIVGDLLKLIPDTGDTGDTGEIADLNKSSYLITRFDDVVEASLSSVQLDNIDKELLQGSHGEAAAIAMKIITQLATVLGSKKLISVSQAHIDSCVYHGPTSLLFAKTLLARGARVAVPTTLNALSVDHRHWQEHGVKSQIGLQAAELGDTFMAMGAQLSYTCAPYLLASAPSYGQQIAWGESNAVAFANSVIGARTQKYPDFLDVCVAITGRAPELGTHTDQGRWPKLCVDVECPALFDDAFWPLLGYLVGKVSAHTIPLVRGLESTTPSTDDLKAFSAAFATTSSMPMFHILGITPEAKVLSDLTDKTAIDSLPCKRLSRSELRDGWSELNTSNNTMVSMVCLGNPHFSFTELEKLARLCKGRKKCKTVQIVVTLGTRVQHLQR